MPLDKAESAKWYAQAMKWYRKAAEEGNAYAQYKLGEMYNFGRGVPENYAEASSRMACCRWPLCGR